MRADPKSDRYWILILVLFASIGFHVLAAETTDFPSCASLPPLDPKVKEGRDSEFQRILCNFKQGDFSLAADELILFCNHYPDDARSSPMADNLLEVYQAHKATLNVKQQAALLKMAPSPGGGAALAWKKAAILFNEDKYENARKQFEWVVLHFPNDEEARLASFYIGECFFKMQQWEGAANAYHNFVLAYPYNERAPNALYQIALCRLREGKYQEAVSDFNNFLEKYPDHQLAKDARLNIASANQHLKSIP